MVDKNRPPLISVNVANAEKPVAGTAAARQLHATAAFSVQLDGPGSLEYLTVSSRTHLEGMVKSFTEQVVAEAKAIEQREHVGKGPPEVTAAHISEAWWVMRRKVRRGRRPFLTFLLRAIETLGAAGIGIGATNYSKRWGAVTFIVCVLIVCAAFVCEAFALRGD